MNHFPFVHPPPPFILSNLSLPLFSGSLEAAIFATKLCKMIGGVEGIKHEVVRQLFPRTIDSINKAVSCCY